MGNGIEQDLLRKFKNSQKELDAANKEIDELKAYCESLRIASLNLIYTQVGDEEALCKRHNELSDIAEQTKQQSLAHIQSKSILDALKFAIDRYDEGNTLASSIELYANQLKQQAERVK